MAREVPQVRSPRETEAEELRLVREIVSSLVLAMKNLGLYPDDHAVSRKTLNALFNRVKAFTDRYGRLTLDVLERHLQYRGNLLSGVAGIEEVAYTCYRDGITRLALADGLKPSELRTFLRILNAHRVAETEGACDMVTDLWEATLLHIRYEVDDRIWHGEPLLDLNRLTLQPASEGAATSCRTGNAPPEETGSHAAAEPQGENASEGAATGTKGGATLADGMQLWQLTDEELRKTRQLVIEEENRDPSRHVFDVLLVLLEEQQAQDDVSTILDIIQECFARALARGQFLYTRTFLSRFHRIREQYRNDGHWAIDSLDDFLLAISRPPATSALNRYLRRMRGGNPKQLRNLTRTLVRLSPECIEPVGAMLGEVPSKPVQHELRKAILHLAKSDVRPLVRLVRNAEPEAAKQGIVILGRIPDENVLPVVEEASRSTEPQVRRAAVHVLAHRSETDHDQLLPFLADQDSWIRRLVFRRLTQERNPDIEASLRDYIRRKRFTRRDRPLLESLYAALGWAGSADSIGFLRDMLFCKPLCFGGMRSRHRAGAAAALAELGVPEAEALLQRGSQSVWPSVRLVVRRGKEHDDGV